MLRKNWSDLVSKMLVTTMLLTICQVAFAQVVMGDLAAPLVQNASKLGMLSGFLAMLLQLAKSPMLGGLFSKVDPSYQPAVVLLVGQLIALVDSLVAGKPFGQAAIEWLLVSGNAMAIYTVVIKPFTKKKSA